MPRIDYSKIPYEPKKSTGERVVCSGGFAGGSRYYEIGTNGNTVKMSYFGNMRLEEWESERRKPIFDLEPISESTEGKENDEELEQQNQEGNARTLKMTK